MEGSCVCVLRLWKSCQGRWEGLREGLTEAPELLPVAAAHKSGEGGREREREGERERGREKEREREGGRRREREREGERRRERGREGGGGKE